MRLSSQRVGGAERRAALARGTLIHAWFEQIGWLEDGEVSDQRLRVAAAALPELALERDQVDRLLKQFPQMLEAPEISACLRRTAYPLWAGARLEVETERPIAVRQDDRLLVGNIDRLVTAYDGDRPLAADILDFKTDALPANDEQALREKVAFYRPQLEAYRLAAASLLRLPPAQVQGHLLFVQPPALVGI